MQAIMRATGMRHLLGFFCAAVLTAFVAAAPVAARAASEPQDVMPKGLPGTRTGFAGLPHMERRGDDLIIHYGEGDSPTTLAGYMKDMAGGDTKIIALEVAGRGRCFIKINSAGATVGAKCDE
jgi:hypothetical protein